MSLSRGRSGGVRSGVGIEELVDDEALLTDDCTLPPRSRPPAERVLTLLEDVVGSVTGTEEEGLPGRSWD